ncbi:MAG: septal ring lytic transglycosylase RlpA family protein [Pseudomonadota bacterium]
MTAAALALAGCASSDKFARKVDPKYGVASSPRVVDFGEQVPKGGGVYRVGKPYVVAGRTYVPEENPKFRAEGLASWYGRDFHGRQTANGEVFDMEAITAAHPTLPMPSYVRVTNLNNKRSLIVRVNDRGPFHSNRVIDLSHKSAELLGFKDHGVARVRVEYIGRAALEGSDDRRLAATLRYGEPAPAPVLVASAGNEPIALPQTPRGVAVGGAVPIPAGRPYNLGEASSPRLTDVTASGRPQRAAVAPVSAASPLRYDTRAGFMSGRGLY